MNEQAEWENMCIGKNLIIKSPFNESSNKKCKQMKFE